MRIGLLIGLMLLNTARLSGAAENKNLCIIIPAYNEAERIAFTLDQYATYFGDRADLLVVLNGCTDNTRDVVTASRAYRTGKLSYLEFDFAGKGYAVKQGFLKALAGSYKKIGFVDADCATMPDAFNVLVDRLNSDTIDGVIASRYIEHAQSSERPITKEWGRRACFIPLVSCMYGLDYKDTQCGAKVFSRKLLEQVAPEMHQSGWSFDVELLYLARHYGFTVIEVPTVWQDREGSHLDSCTGGIPMIFSLCCLQ